MGTSEGIQTGDDLLAAVTRVLVDLHERFHGRAPVGAKSLLMDGTLLVSILSGVYTEVEKTMIELGRLSDVYETRRAFHASMRDTFIAEIERLSGRKVVGFVPSYHVNPDLEVKIFVLAPAMEPAAREDDGR